MTYPDIPDPNSSGYTENLSNEIKETGLEFPKTEFTDPVTLYVSKSGAAQLIAVSRFGKRYLLKCLKEDFRYNPVYRTALLKEFEIGISLDHPNIRRTIGFEEVEGFGPAIVLEYIDGATLQDLLERKEITSRKALSILGQIGSALEYLHNKQVIHRDLKPANVLVTYSGNAVKLIDFNLSDSQVFTVVKMQAGTRNYMAPELFLPGHTANAATDIYSFGAIMKEMAEATSDKRIARLAAECMADDPHKRPASVGEINLNSLAAEPGGFSGLSFSSAKMTHLLLLLIAFLALWIAAVLFLRNSPLSLTQI
ncbi:MAG: serine/threonine protein kinase [Muribaculaceae bacterium]|nr:serine/threonine protein kinase [Muribaculaceae bacterium]